MKLPEEGYMLKIVIGESLRHKGVPLYEWVVATAREHGIAGATVYRGIMGYGASSRIKTSSILILSEDLPMIIELIDSKKELENFLDILDPVIHGGLITLQKLNIHMYRPKRG